MTTEAQFLKDVQGHQLTVIRDEGVYRHLRFARPLDRNQYFDIVTWPGVLAYTGDMGTYVFERVPDMLTFFREKGGERPQGGPLRINAPYWSEKLEAVYSRRHRPGATEFCEALFRKHVADYVEDWSAGLGPEDLATLNEALDASLWSPLGDYGPSEEHAYRLAYEFSVQVSGRTLKFTDFHECDCSKFTHHYLWCCYALVWGIRLYDATKAGPGPVQLTEDPDHGEEVEAAAC